MWKLLTVSSKGQITLPKELREQLGLRAGDELIYTVVGDHVVVTPKSIDFNDLAGFLGAPPNGPATLEQIDETVAREGGKAALPPSSRPVKSNAA